jgi:hypothetical protein
MVVLLFRILGTSSGCRLGVLDESKEEVEGLWLIPASLLPLAAIGTKS